MAISWASTSLPNPTKYSIKYLQIGATHLVATGAQVFDIIAEKREVTITWDGISTADKDSIVTKATTFASGSLNLAGTGGAGGPTAFNVIPQPGEITTEPYGVTPVWTVTVTVREV